MLVARVTVEDALEVESQGALDRTYSEHGAEAGLGQPHIAVPSDGDAVVASLDPHLHARDLVEVQVEAEQCPVEQDRVLAVCPLRPG